MVLGIILFEFSRRSNVMNFGQAFSFPFQDPDWLKKIGLMALVSLIPIVGQIILLGWSLDITRRIIQRSPILLPEINLGEHLTEGFKAFIVSFVYSIPLIVMNIPITVSSMMMESAQGNSDATTTAFVLVTLCCAGIMVLYGLFMGVTLPAAFGNMIAQNRLGAAFDFKTVLGMVRSAPAAYLLVLAGSFLGSLIASLGMIVCFVGIIFTTVYYFAVMGNLYGQAYNEAANHRYLSQPGM
jgi:hypothetical protein